MVTDDVFSRRWVLAEDELLKMLWRCHAGENPDVVLVELYANCREDRHRSPVGGYPRRVTRGLRRDRKRVPGSGREHR